MTQNSQSEPFFLVRETSLCPFTLLQANLSSGLPLWVQYQSSLTSPHPSTSPCFQSVLIRAEHPNAAALDWLTEGFGAVTSNRDVRSLRLFLQRLVTVMNLWWFGRVDLQSTRVSSGGDKVLPGLGDSWPFTPVTLVGALIKVLRRRSGRPWSP